MSEGGAGIRVGILKSEPIPWRSLVWLQGGLKEMKKADMKKLKASLIRNNFIQPFNVWNHDGSLYCLDGHHRFRVLQELEQEGVTIPEMLPANFIDCKDRKTAARLALVYSSAYARTTEDGLYEFMHAERLSFPEIEREVSLPEFSLADFKRGWIDDGPPADDKGDTSTKDSISFVPDALFPSDNEFGIPTLDPDLQATVVEMPVNFWGAWKRKQKTSGTCFFYVDGYRFNRLWTDPRDFLNSGCVAAAEMNFSIFDNYPKAVALWRIYQKRWMSRLFQSYGIRIFADLNVSRQFADLNTIGIPKGWRSFATRGNGDAVENLDHEFQIAKKIAGKGTVVFVVVGGGKAVEARCQKAGWIYLEGYFGRKGGV